MLQARFFPLLGLLTWLLFPAFVPAQETAPLPVIQLRTGKSPLTVEVARTPEQKARGLMQRTRLADNAGMLFVLDGKSRASFWMKDTALPLSIAFLNAQGVILEIVDLQPFDETAIRSQSDKIAFALEMNQNWFSLNGVKAGDTLTIVGGSWKTFFNPTPAPR